MTERQTERSQSIPRLWPFKRLFYGWGIVGTSMVVLIAQVPMYGPVLSVFVKPIGDDLGWSRGEISLAFTLGTLVGLSVSSIVGAKIDRYGARVAVVSAGVVVTASLAGLALMQEVWQFWLLFGLGRTAALSGINLGTTVAVANWFVRKRGRAVSLLVIGLRGGQALFPLFITPIIILLSWRHAYATRPSSPSSSSSFRGGCSFGGGPKTSACGPTVCRPSLSRRPPTSILPRRGRRPNGRSRRRRGRLGRLGGPRRSGCWRLLRR